MTISTTTSRISYTGDGSTVQYAIPFYFQVNADIVVYVNGVLQVIGTNYTLTGATLSAGGTCTFVSAPASTLLVVIYRDPQMTQTTSYNNNDPFPAKSHELALDKALTIDQRTRDISSRALHIPDSESSSTVTTLAVAATRANKLLAFDNNGALSYAVGPTFVGTTATGVAVVDTKATAQVTTFAGSVNVIRTFGSATPGDGLGRDYIRGTSGSPTPFQSADGAYWTPVTSVPYAAIQNVTGSRLLGNPSSTGAASEISLGVGLAFSGTTLIADPIYNLGRISGLALSAAGGTTTFSIGLGVAADGSTGAMMSLASAYTKTTSAWAVGTATGALDIGTIANSTCYHIFAIKRVDTGVVDILASLSSGLITGAASATATLTIASPGNVAITRHGLQANAPVVFTTTGALPTGLVAGTTYFVKTVVDNNNFTVSATQGGTAIAFTGSQSGVHTAVSSPTLPTNYTLKRRIGSMLTGAAGNWQQVTQLGDEFIYGDPIGDVNVSNQSTSAILYTLTVPTGIQVNALFRFSSSHASANTFVLVNSPDENSVATNSPAANVTTANPLAGGAAGAHPTLNVRTNTSGQIRIISAASSTSVTIATYGYIDTRGRL